jgi:hypothetical protein
MSLVQIDWSVRGKRSQLRLQLAIPRAYVTRYIVPTKDDRYGFVRLETGLPDLQPRPATVSCWGKHGEEREKCLVYRGNGMYINMANNRALGAHQPSSDFFRTKQNVKAYLGAPVKRKDDVHGLQHYVELKGGGCVRRDLIPNDPTVREELKELARSTNDKYVCWPEGDEYFVSVGDGSSPDTVVKCKALFESSNFGSKCVGEINFSGWSIEFGFPGSELQRWREFETGARTLLANLSVK